MGADRRGGHPNQIVDAGIKQSIDSQMETKGLAKTDNDKADLYVGYQISVEKQWNAYGGAAAAVGVVWERQPVRPLTSELLYWTCMTQKKAARLDRSCYQGNEPEPKPGKEPEKPR
jgi:hypothetical protein